MSTKRVPPGAFALLEALFGLLIASLMSIIVAQEITRISQALKAIEDLQRYPSIIEDHGSIDSELTCTQEPNHAIGEYTLYCQDPRGTERTIVIPIGIPREHL
jgi:hypothetical protein